MSANIYRYTFERDVPTKEVESTLVLALLAAGGMFGEARLRLESAHLLDRKRRICVIDARGPAGRAANCIFVALVTREFGACSFKVEHMRRSIAKTPTSAARAG
jgi:hypothetical protein